MTLWLERSGNGEWRWKVICVQTGEQAYFRYVHEAMNWVSQQAGVPGPW